MSAGQGFQKHEASSLHINTMLSWKEKQSRTKVNQPISSFLNQSVLEKRRYYFSAIIQNVLFLAKNELPYRGTYYKDEKKESGLFNSLFEYRLEIDERLKECQTQMPDNGKYTSGQIQNEIIHVIADELRKSIVNEINNSSYVTLLVDGAKDRNKNELLSIAFRYINDAVPHETLITIEKTDDLTAAGLLNVITSTIETLQIKKEKIISQCYDGANTMSGCDGGLQKLLEKHYNRPIPYVHCFNHRLHLVVEYLVKNVNACRLFFGEVRMLHDFFSRFKVKREYSGTNIPRLMETRWTGHLDAIQSIRKNYQEIIVTLKKIKEDKDKNFEAVDVALAKGILNTIETKSFIFFLFFLNDLFGALDPANQILQTRTVGYRQAKPVIDATIARVQELRSDASFDRIVEATEETMSMSQNEDEQHVSRIRRRSTRLSNSIVTETIGERESENDNITLKAPFNEAIDYVLNEMKRRFDDNDAILTAMSELNKILSDDFDINALAPLERIGLKLPTKNEMDVVRKFLSSEVKKPENQQISILKILTSVKAAFETTYRLFEAFETFGSSTAINECCFSAVNRIDTVRRMSMTDQRLRELAFLAFEKKRLSVILMILW